VNKINKLAKPIQNLGIIFFLPLDYFLNQVLLLLLSFWDLLGCRNLSKILN
jgi:hypothetical protein